MSVCKTQIPKRILFIVGIVANVGMLGYYKYTDFGISILNRISPTDFTFRNILLPVGISFFTFKAVSYLADIYKGKAELVKSPVHDALYLSFFAQILSGPLTRYNDMQASEKKIFDYELFSDGVIRFLIGFNKKILIADNLSRITKEIFAAPTGNLSLLYAWLGSIAFSLQIFFDFSGYSDMAIGVSEMFGYHCMENFNYPYMTESVSKFWRRWHISLSEWFRDYIYIPMGGSRNKKKWRVFLNLFVVWALTGLWHGASGKFILWGLGYFILIAFERLTKLPERIKNKPGKIVYRILTLLFINFQWVLFNASSLTNGLNYWRRMILPQADSALRAMADYRAVVLLKEYAAFLIVGVILCFPVVPWVRKKLEGKKAAVIAYDTVVYLVVLAGFILSVSFIVAGGNNPFAYANF
jgi:alginate O-acetyltransferase complex protein AlgI